MNIEIDICIPNDLEHKLEFELKKEVIFIYGHQRRLQYYDPSKCDYRSIVDR